MVLYEKKQSFRLISVKPWEYEETFLRINPANTTPVAITESDTVLRGLYPIIEYLEELKLEPNLFIGEIEHRAHIRYVFEWFYSKFNHEVTRYIFSEKIIKMSEGIESPNSAAIRTAKQNILQHLDYIAYLLSGGTYLCGEKMTIADCMAAAHLSVLDLVKDVPWEYNEKVRGWYALMKSRSSFQKILNDEVHGIAIPAHYTNPDF